MRMFVGTPLTVAEHAPDRPAIVMAGTGEQRTFGELAERINRASRLLRSLGLVPGDSVALYMRNHLCFLEVAWAAQLSGLYLVAVNTHLTASETRYIVDDCGAKVLVTCSCLQEPAVETVRGLGTVEHCLVMHEPGGSTPPAEWLDYETALAREGCSPLSDASEGDYMLYSSGTTGRPKGIRRPLTFAEPGHPPDKAVELLRSLGFGPEETYLSPTPLYHGAPLSNCLAVHRLGGTVIVMERFDAATALELIERHRVTTTTLVPTMFVRLLKLPAEVRLGYDVSTLKCVAHSAAPCAVDVKQRMIDWLGPVVTEWYGSTEACLVTMIGAHDWLTHPGSVGKAIIGTAHVTDDDGRELPPGEIGTIWGEAGVPFEYHNDPVKTADAHDSRGWATVGDVGYVDPDGYLYLTDRKSYTIISGGVNIYPREIEDVLAMHPEVADVAVFGVPSPDMGEDVKAVVQPSEWSHAGASLASTLIEYCAQRLARYKCPRSIDFDPELPRAESGKLYKRRVQERYWGDETREKQP